MTGVAELLYRLGELASPFTNAQDVESNGSSQANGDQATSIIFRSQRYHPHLPYLREDENLFFSATIAYTLLVHFQVFDDAERKIASKIIDGVKAIIPHFRNKDGKPTYNFWPTDPSKHFPNGMLMHRMEHFKIPDDADDTALAHLLLNHDEKEKTELHALLFNHANKTRKRIKNTWPEFTDLRAISTFFGEKMRIEFDAVVMCNSLLFLLDHFNPDDELIHDSTLFIDGVLESNRHISEPFYAAPNYPTTELIIYHVARLLQKHPNCKLNKHTKKLTGQLRSLLQQDLTPVSTLLCENALLMLKKPEEESATKAALPMLDQLLNDKKGYFFHAGMLSAFENKLAQDLSTNSFFHLRYRCEALNLVLWIENELLKKSLST